METLKLIDLSHHCGVMQSYGVREIPQSVLTHDGGCVGDYNCRGRVMLTSEPGRWRAVMEYTPTRDDLVATVWAVRGDSWIEMYAAGQQDRKTGKQGKRGTS